MGLKPMKIRKADDFKLYGIAAKSREQLIHKGLKVLNIKEEEFQRIELVDSTIVEDDDYWCNLEKNTVLVFITSHSTGSPARYISDALKALRMDKKTAEELFTLARSMEDKLQREAVLSLVRNLTGNFTAETREEDPDWFSRVADSKVKTKSEVMELSAMNRVRSYLYEVRNHIRDVELTEVQRSHALTLISTWTERLKAHCMYRYYFSRKTRKPYTYCDSQGWFTCEGDYQASSCPSYHYINPYLSAEHRAVFSQWNLDHRIEKARTVIPTIVELLRKEKTTAGLHGVNWDYFYDMLFTRANLKLVHIACHVKQGHTDAVLDKNLLYSRSTTAVTA